MTTAHSVGRAQSVVWLLTGLGVVGVVRVKGTSTVFANGWTGRVLIDNYRQSNTKVIADVLEKYPRELGAPFLVRVREDVDLEDALVTIKLEDFAALLASRAEGSKR